MKEKLKQLFDLKAYIETPVFQEYLVQPIYKELDKLKSASKCKTWDDVCELKGEEKGLRFMVKLLKEVDREIKNTRFDIEQETEDTKKL